MKITTTLQAVQRTAYGLALAGAGAGLLAGLGLGALGAGHVCAALAALALLAGARLIEASGSFRELADPPPPPAARSAMADQAPPRRACLYCGADNAAHRTRCHGCGARVR